MAVRKFHIHLENYANRERQMVFGRGPERDHEGQECWPWSTFSTGACCTFGVGRSGWAPSVSVAAALMVVPVERTACSIFFSVVANGSYETWSAPFSILVSITPSNASTASVGSFWRTGSPSSLISIRAAMVSLRLESAGSGLLFMP